MATKQPAGMARLNLSLPAKTVEFFRELAALEGVPMQSLIAPVLNAVARGAIRNFYELTPDAHGNAKGGRERQDPSGQ